MPIKSLLYRFQPAPLYIILLLSICYFSVQLVLSHITHALTLLISSYHMLCNILALAGCIITIKQSNQKTDAHQSSIDLCGKVTCAEGDCTSSNNAIDNTSAVVVSFENCGDKKVATKKLSKCERREIKLRNTFGWARIDVLAMLIVCIILASLSFSLLVEALQTLVHIDHQDTMHLPIPVMLLGFVGLMLNGLTYYLIGGYTLHQGSFLHVMENGNVVLDRTMSNSADLALQPEERQLSSAKLAQDQRVQDEKLKQQLQSEGIKTVTKKDSNVKHSVRRQGAVELLRDVSSTIFVIVCGFVIYMAEDVQDTAKFIDPILSIFSCILLVALSYRYMKESCFILLQTIPDSIDLQNFESTLVKRFPQIVSYHDLHIWQLAANKYIATVHIQFESPKLYASAIDEVRTYFHENGIAEVTIQPEFFSGKISISSVSGTPSMECLMQCSAPECAEKVCCKDSRTDLREVVSNYPDGGKQTEPIPLIGSIQMPTLTKQTTAPAQIKSNIFKKILPRLNTAKGMERSKSTNDLSSSDLKISGEQQKKLEETSNINMKKTVSESNMDQNNFTDIHNNDKTTTVISKETKLEPQIK